MVFFPDACFYEFIPEQEMRRNLAEPDYQPRTCLMDEIQAGETYELVISVLHGGAFMRYRIGDMYHCLSAGGGQLPRLTLCGPGAHCHRHRGLHPHHRVLHAGGHPPEPSGPGELGAEKGVQ